MAYTELNKLALDAKNIAHERCERLDTAFDKAITEHDWMAIMKKAAVDGFHGIIFKFDHPYKSRYYVCKFKEMLCKSYFECDDQIRIEILYVPNKTQIPNVVRVIWVTVEECKQMAAQNYCCNGLYVYMTDCNIIETLGLERVPVYNF